jgi:uncharacterized small protein (DUF1192 family)
MNRFFSKESWELRKELYSPKYIPNRIGVLKHQIEMAKSFQATQNEPEVNAVCEAEIAAAEAEIARLEAMMKRGVKFLK